MRRISSALVPTSPSATAAPWNPSPTALCYPHPVSYTNNDSNASQVVNWPLGHVMQTVSSVADQSSANHQNPRSYPGLHTRGQTQRTLLSLRDNSALGQASSDRSRGIRSLGKVAEDGPPTSSPTLAFHSGAQEWTSNPQGDNCRLNATSIRAGPSSNGSGSSGRRAQPFSPALRALRTTVTTEEWEETMPVVHAPHVSADLVDPSGITMAAPPHDLDVNNFIAQIFMPDIQATAPSQDEPWWELVHDQLGTISPESMQIPATYSYSPESVEGLSLDLPVGQGTATGSQL
ncbi:hypothetical protein BN946_scf184985.g55 [Trametes cinnabarina]|uniref:Uncharacterized protein n=1 Tax=Pycnoporus cinnabarinus TaxID=5643 RepID=A0A060SEI4_PYCCI|nr:hypothetical protein BN946_scf184985.g55 [Trametes cinnabarina]